MIEEIKKIPLATFLSQLGYEPAYRRGNGLWYRSPLRQENTPSFKVQLDKNTWYDFGIAKGGTIIDLAAELYHPKISAISWTALSSVALYHRRRQSLPLMPRDTMLRVLRT